MTELQRKMMEKLGLTESDFVKSDSEPTKEERLEAMEAAIMELAEVIVSG